MFIVFCFLQCQVRIERHRERNRVRETRKGEEEIKEEGKGKTLESCYTSES